MCGIAGFYNSNIDRKKTIMEMNARMYHRGPDMGSFWLDDQSGWTFGHRRLSILDLSENGVQPMFSLSGRFVICYNGEIYNITALRDRMLKERVISRFRGTSDTEVLVEAIEAYGIENVLSNCKGMFALALYDRTKRELTLVRDRVGEKPVYYGYIKEPAKAPFFAFASDLALFTKIPGFQKEINRDALAQFMLYNYISAPMTIYSDIFKLRPGQMLRLKAPFDQPEIITYWSMKSAAIYGENHIFDGSMEEAERELEKLLTSAVEGQMEADVPLGAFLSGGIDSTLVVSLMQSISEQPIKTFTIGFDDLKYNEAEYSKEIAGYLGTDHTELYLSEKEMRDAVFQMPYYYSEPFGDASMLPTYFLCRLARGKVKVSLSGEAGDELFCGYDGYWKGAEFWRKEQYIPYVLRNAVGKLILKTGVRNSFVFRGAGCLRAANICQLKDMIFNRKSYYAENIVLNGNVALVESIEANLKDPYNAMGLQDMMEYHPDDILVKIDRAGMAVSLENRIPMLDKDVIEFAWRLPSNYKYENNISKKILRNILYKYVPKEMMERPKQGFCVPLEKWLLQGDMHIWAAELMSSSKLADNMFLDKNIIDLVWKRFLKDQADVRLVWNILMAEQWYRETYEML